MLLAGLCFLSSAATFASDFSFRTDILPILSKAGCNSGACHGAATGQGGFHLSLLGYDPEEDYWSITREFSGRRVSLDAPRESLFLRKPAQQIEHEGGRRIPRDSASYSQLVEWINAGAPYGSRALKVARIEAEPPERFFAETNEPFQLKVVAVLNDGTRRDVTDLALYSSNDEGIAEVDKNGLGRTRHRGVTSIMIRYSGQVAAVRVAIPFSTPILSAPLAADNFIDQEIVAELNRLGLPPSELSEDAEFFRRVHLDLIGQMPDSGKVRKFLREAEKDRGKIIDQLLESEEFADFWTLKFADLLLISGKRGSEKAAAVYHDWLREQISQNTAWDAVAAKLLTARGDSTREGPPNFYLHASDPRDIAEYAGSIFLGTQIGCARCHAHPTDRWTQDDYYEFSACFAGVSRDGSVVRTTAGRALEYPKSKRAAAPKALGGSGPLPAQADPRAAMAKVLTADPLFARALVNRVWKHLLGRGLVEPADDLRPTNPATHPALLDKLAGEFRTHHFDLRWLIRSIASSRTYQLSSLAQAANRHDDRFYSRAYLKPLSAQVLVDAIAQVTGRPERFDGQPEGTRAVQLIGAQTESYALDVLGRCPREKTCETGAGVGGGLAQALHLINGSTINQKLAGGVTAELNSKSDSEVVEELYLRALSRGPADEELEFWKAILDRAPNRTEAIEDFLWTLLNSREFAFNH
jgi:hypothetical protein